jgi:hypothetical protein
MSSTQSTEKKHRLTPNDVEAIEIIIANSSTFANLQCASPDFPQKCDQIRNVFEKHRNGRSDVCTNELIGKILDPQGQPPISRSNNKRQTPGQSTTKTLEALALDVKRRELLRQQISQLAAIEERFVSTKANYEELLNQRVILLSQKEHTISAIRAFMKISGEFRSKERYLEKDAKELSVKCNKFAAESDTFQYKIRKAAQWLNIVDLFDPTDAVVNSTTAENITTPTEPVVKKQRNKRPAVELNYPHQAVTRRCKKMKKQARLVYGDLQSLQQPAVNRQSQSQASSSSNFIMPHPDPVDIEEMKKNVIAYEKWCLKNQEKENEPIVLVIIKGQQHETMFSRGLDSSTHGFFKNMFGIGL